MTITPPGWLAKRGAGLADGSDPRTWFVLFRREPQYKLVPVPVVGKFGCAITQTINGKQQDLPTPAPSLEEAVRAGLEVLRQSLVKLEPPGIPPSAVQHQQRGSLSAVQQLHLQASNRDLFFPPITCHAVSPPSVSQVRRCALLV